MELDFNDLEVNNIKVVYDTTFFGKDCTIEFQLNGEKKYFVSASRFIDQWVVLISGHAETTETKHILCPYCKKASNSFNICKPIKEKEQELFSYLVNHPHIRTRWLFEKNT